MSSKRAALGEPTSFSSRWPQSNGFIERLHRTLLDEHFCIKGREKFYESVTEMQADLDAYFVIYNMVSTSDGVESI